MSGTVVDLPPTMSSAIYEVSGSERRGRPHVIAFFPSMGEGADSSELFDLYGSSFAYSLQGSGIDVRLTDGNGIAVADEKNVVAVIIATATDYRLPPGTYRHSLDVTNRQTGSTRRWFDGDWIIEAEG